MMEYFCQFCQQRSYSQKICDGVLFKKKVVDHKILFSVIFSLDTQHQKQRGKEKNKDEVKNEIIRSLVKDDVVQNKDLNKRKRT